MMVMVSEPERILMCHMKCQIQLFGFIQCKKT